MDAEIQRKSLQFCHFIPFKEPTNKQILRLRGSCFQIAVFYLIIALLTQDAIAFLLPQWKRQHEMLAQSVHGRAFTQNPELNKRGPWNHANI